MKRMHTSSCDSVYIQQSSDARWSVCFSATNPGEGFVKLCEEKDYPVSLFYERQDMNGSVVVEMDVCKNRKELLDSLNWVGQCRSIVRSLWDFDYLNNQEQRIYDIFAAAWRKKMALWKEEWDNLARDDLRDYMSALETEYEQFANLEEVACFTSQELNTNLVGCVREALTHGDVNYIAKFVLQHVNHYVSYCEAAGDTAALKEMDQLLHELYKKYGIKLEPEVCSACCFLAERQLSVTFSKPSLADKLQTAEMRADHKTKHTTEKTITEQSGR